MAEDETVATSVVDHLDQDPVLRGQQFACISFVSPEEVIAKKEVYAIGRFLEGISTDISVCLENIKSAYGDKDVDGVTVSESIRLIRERYSYLWSSKDIQAEFAAYSSAKDLQLDEDFRKEFGSFRTSVRGFKIRGVYDNIDDAKRRAQTVRDFDSKFNVYIAEVGCWCPWSPNPDDISDVNYAETQLNTLMKKYRENQDNRVEMYRDRKDMLTAELDATREVWLNQIREKLKPEESSHEAEADEAIAVGPEADEAIAVGPEAGAVFDDSAASNGN